MTSPSRIRPLSLLGESNQDRVEKLHPRSRINSRTSLRRRLLASCLALVVTGSTGCTVLTNACQQLQEHEALDEFMISHRNKVMAAKAWYRQSHCFADHRHPEALKEGFIAGYVAVAEGGDGCVPSLAPSKYWGWRYQSAAGQQAVNAWFAGYPLGAKAAEQAGIGHWSQIRPAGMVPAGAEAAGGAEAHATGEAGVEMVPTPFVEEDGTLPEPGLLDSDESINGNGESDRARPNTGSDELPAAGDAVNRGAQANADSSLNAPAQGRMNSEFIEIFGQPAKAAGAAQAESGGELPYSFD